MNQPISHKALLCDIDAIEKRVNAATDGPWAYFNTGDKGGPSWVLGTIYDTREEDMVWHTGCVEPDIYNEETTEFVQVADIMDRIAFSDDNASRIQDAEFISHARTDIPVLLAEVRRTREAITKWRAWWLGMADEAANAGTQSGDYNARLYRDIIEDFDRRLK